MKHFIRLAICLIALAGCSKEMTEIDDNPINNEDSTIDYPTISASFDNAGTRTSLGLEQNGAKVLWTGGDEITVCYDLVDQDAYRTLIYKTEDDGVATASFTSTGSITPEEVSYCTAFYPSDTRYIKGFGARLYVPSKQKAIKGGIEERLNTSYATASSYDECLNFKNALSLLQFRITGDVVSKITSVRFIATSTIAADCVFNDFDNEDPTYRTNSWINEREEEPSYTIELMGPFEEDADYLMATIPCSTEGFSLIFADEDGNYCVKHSSKTMTLKRSRITNIGTIRVDSFNDDSTVKYLGQTKGSKPVDIVVIPDGFTSSQRAKFESLAVSAMDYIFSVEPYSTLKDYFNVYFMWKASADQGASITYGSGNITTHRNTAFGSKWGENKYTDMTADDDKVYSFVSSHCPEIIRGELTINEVPVLLIINDDRYGGIAHITSSGRTYCQAPYTYNGETLYWGYASAIAASDDPADGFNTRAVTEEETRRLGSNSGDWRNIVLHEFAGHSIGRFADEYWHSTYPTQQGPTSGHSWPVPYALNVSGYYDNVPWQELLDRREDLILKDNRYERLGRFQGANTYIFNYWRSEEISCMIDNRPYFSTWQRALLTKRILELAGEGFNLDTFLENNNPTDPIRDEASATINSPATVNRGPVHFVPPLAPPVLTEE